MNLPVEIWIVLFTGLFCGWRFGRLQIKQAFRALPTAALASTHQTFLDLAKTTLAAYQKQATGERDNRQQRTRR